MRKLELKEGIAGKWVVVEQSETPIMIMGLEARSFQIAEFHSHLDALLFISAALPETEQGMGAEYQRWLLLNDLRDKFEGDAQELLMSAEEEGLTEEQQSYLIGFIQRWDEASAAPGFYATEEA